VTAAAEVVAVAEADGVAAGFFAAAGVLPPVNAIARPAMRPSTQATARPMPNR
jgi:hypothetical protein